MSLPSFLNGFERYLNDNGKPIKFLENPKFQQSNKMLELKLKINQKEGKDLGVVHKPVITKDDLLKLTKSPALSPNSPEMLLNTVWSYVMYYWCWPEYKCSMYGIETVTKCLRHSYNLSETPFKEPNPQVCYDLCECNSCALGSCLTSEHCSICKEPLKQLIENKVSQFKGFLEKFQYRSHFLSEDDGASFSVVNSKATNINAEKYYTSGTWEQKALTL